MSYQGINFVNQRLVPSDDGRLYQKIFNDGALYGCELSYSGAVLFLSPGFLMIGGREIELDAAEQIPINEAISGFAQLVISIDLTQTATKDSFNQISMGVRYAAAEDGFATLVQDDINGSGSRYEAQLALVSLGAGGITGIIDDMPQAAFRGAADGLNLKVVGGTEQPISPAENSVWVNTDTAINGYAFSADEPASPAEGMVWFATGTSSSAAMNVDKKNTVMIYPAGCKQYVSGNWVSKTARSYINGAWVEWVRYLYRAGDMDTGFVALGWIFGAGATARAPEIDYGVDSVVFTATTEQYGGRSGVAYFPNKVDLSQYSTLTADATLAGSISANNRPEGLYIWSEVGTGNYVSAAVARALFNGVGDKILTIDVSELSGEYYIGFGLRYENTPAETITVREVTLE